MAPVGMTASEINSWVTSHCDEALLADGFDAAIVGIGERCGQPPIVVYDAEKCIDILIEGGMSREDAEEYFGFNTLGAWMGEGTPLFMWRAPD